MATMTIVAVWMSESLRPIPVMVGPDQYCGFTRTILRRYDSDVTTTKAYLERCDATRNMARYYRLSVVQTLFGQWALIREWGRIGRGGQSREHWCGSQDEAATLLDVHLKERQRRGYR